MAKGRIGDYSRAKLLNIVDSRVIETNGDITAVTAGNGLAGGGTVGGVSLNVDINSATDGTGIDVSVNDTLLIADADDSNNVKKINISQLPSVTGDITAVTAGNGLSGGGTEAAVSLAVDIDGATDGSGVTVTTSDQLLLADADDSNNVKKITISQLPAVTSVVAGDALSGGGSTAAVTLDVDIDGATDGTGVTVSTSDILLIADVDDSNNVKKITVSQLPSMTGDIDAVTAGNGLSGGGTSGTVALAIDINGATDGSGITVHNNDLVLIADIDDSNNVKKVSASQLPVSEVTAGNALSGGGTASSIVISVDVDGATDGSGITVSNSDQMLIADADDSNNVKKITVSQLPAAGSATQLQYNNGGVFGAMSSVTWDGTDLSIADDTKIKFGTNGDAHIEYNENGDDFLIISGSSKGIALSGSTIEIRGTLVGASPLKIAGGVEMTSLAGQPATSLSFGDDIVLGFGDDDDASIKFISTNEYLEISGSTNGIIVSGTIKAANSITASSMSSTFTGDGSSVTNVNATQLNSQAASYYLDFTNQTVDANEISGDKVHGGSISGLNQLTASYSSLGTAIATTLSASANISASMFYGDGTNVTGVNAATADNATQLNSQAASYYLDADNVNAGTLNNARLPSTISQTQISASTGISSSVGQFSSLKINDSSLVDNLNADRLDSQEGSYYLDFTNQTVDNDEISGDKVHGGSISGLDQLTASYSSLGTAIATTFSASANVSASAFIGDGSSLTNVNANNTSQLNNQAASYYLDADNINAGTLNNSRLPSTISQAQISASAGISSSVGQFGSLEVNSNSLVDNLNADQLDNQEGSYYLDFTNQTVDDNEISGDKIHGGSISGLGQLTASHSSLGTAAATTLSASANVSASAFIGDGSFITNVDASQLNSQAASYYLDFTNQTVDNDEIGGDKIHGGSISGLDQLTASYSDLGVSVGTSLSASSFISASVFYGDGSNLTGVGGGSGGHTIQNAGSDLTARTYLNFTGSGVTAVDDSGTDATIVTINVGSGSGETNTTSNEGAGYGLAMTKVNSNLPFKTLIAGDNISIVTGSDTITIQYSAPSVDYGYSPDPGFTVGTRILDSGLDLVAGGVSRMFLSSSGYIGVNMTSDITHRLTLPNSSTGNDGKAVAYSWATYSSARYKENIETIKDPLAITKALRGVRYNWKDSQKSDIGLIAEEVGKHLPEIVEWEENKVDAKSLDYTRLVPILVEAIKNQQSQIDKLKDQIIFLNDVLLDN